MNYALILAGGVGQRMRNSGKPKQFLEVYGKPIIMHTIAKFEDCDDVDQIIVACNVAWIDYLNDLIKRFGVSKEISVISGGRSRQDSLANGISYINECGGRKDDIVIIHDGVRPLIDVNIISENVRVSRLHGCAITVSPVVESVVITDKDIVSFEDFKKRDDTYTLTAPQTFVLETLEKVYNNIPSDSQSMPLLDAALAYTYLGGQAYLVKENNHNIKITTPEDYYILKAMLELEENKTVFGIN